MKMITLLCAAFLLTSCGGGGSSSVNNNEISDETVVETEPTLYACAPFASSQDSFAISSGRPDFTKDTGIDLTTYLVPDLNEGDNDSEKETKNSYITRSFKEYFFGRFPATVKSNFAPFTIQTLLVGGWYLTGDDYTGNASINLILDEDLETGASSFHASIGANVDAGEGGLLISFFSSLETARYADIGDIIHYSSRSDAFIQRETSCQISTNPVEGEITSVYPNALPISCTLKQSTGSLFAGIKLNFVLAQNIGVVSESTDTYNAIIENTQDTQRICTQEVKELVSSQVVDRVYINELDSVTP